MSVLSGKVAARRLSPTRVVVCVVTSALMIASLTPAAAFAKAEKGSKKRPEAKSIQSEKNAEPTEKSAYDYSLPGPDGTAVSLASYRGKYLLVVNLARKSTYSDQLAGLIKFQDTYKDKGFVVIGVPCNDFGAEEPGTSAEVEKTYQSAKVNFPVVAVSKLTGVAELPFYQFLTTSKGAPAGGPVHWNFTKFVVDPNGHVIARFDPDVAPDSSEMLARIDEILSGKAKPAKAGSAAVEEAQD